MQLSGKTYSKTETHQGIFHFFSSSPCSLTPDALQKAVPNRACVPLHSKPQQQLLAVIVQTWGIMRSKEFDNPRCSMEIMEYLPTFTQWMDWFCWKIFTGNHRFSHEDHEDHAALRMTRHIWSEAPLIHDSPISSAAYGNFVGICAKLYSILHHQFIITHFWDSCRVQLVGGWATPLKNMSSSIGMMTETQYFWENKIDGNHSPPTRQSLIWSDFIAKKFLGSSTKTGPLDPKEIT